MTLTDVEADGMTIADAAQATGLSVHTLRYYERAGLMLDRVRRAASTHRRYTTDDIAWVHFLTRLRSTGMPIRRVREYADMVRAGEGNESDRLALLEQHRADVLAQMAEMQRHLEAINCKIDIYREGIG
jgi:DNA-binding transcriptional MerR regulator